MKARRKGLLILFITAMLLWAPGAGDECKTCSGNNPGQQQAAVEESMAAFLSDTLGKPAKDTQKTEEPPQEDAAFSQRSKSFSQVLVPLSAVKDSEVLLDISPEATEYIAGAININYEDFLSEDKRLKPASQLSEMLGEAGISQEDSVLIYGECQPCGGGPSAATYVYWAMKYLGHEKVQLLDGGIDDWVAALEPTDIEPAVLPPNNYIPTIRPDLMATYEYVKSGQAQIVDARTLQEFGTGSIPGSINIPYDSVLDGKNIKDEASLEKVFAALIKDKPVVVYTNTGIKASMVWFALTLMGYDARLFTWQDWLANQPKLNIELREVSAEPNPAQRGDVVKITAIFGEKSPDVISEQIEEPAPASSNASNDTILTIKGCATCGFGSPQGFADISKDTGMVQIGSSARSTAKSSATENGFRCTAKITTPSGTEVGKAIMKRISGDEFSGIWNANVAAGIYKISLVASAGEVTQTFKDVLEMEVVSPTSKYKNLGK